MEVGIDCCFQHPVYLGEIKKNYIPSLLNVALHICVTMTKEAQNMQNVTNCFFFSYLSMQTKIINPLQHL